MKRGDHFGNQDSNRKIILQLILNYQYVTLLTEFDWLMVWSSCCCESVNESERFIKGGNSCEYQLVKKVHFPWKWSLQYSVPTRAYQWNVFMYRDEVTDTL
jgi:hypothetical protein